jgi:quercetin dioxygenase-like cupin family protein
LKSEYISTIEEIENMEEQTFEPGKKYNLAASIDVAEGGIVSKQFIKNKGGNITIFAFAKGQGLSEHTAPFNAVVQIISGLAEVSIDGVRQLVGEGEMILMPANIPHALYATEAFKMCLIMLKD